MTTYDHNDRLREMLSIRRPKIPESLRRTFEAASPQQPSEGAQTVLRLQEAVSAGTAKGYEGEMLAAMKESGGYLPDQELTPGEADDAYRCFLGDGDPGDEE